MSERRRRHQTRAVPHRWFIPSLANSSHDHAQAASHDGEDDDRAHAIRAQRGDSEAFDRLVELFSTRMYTHLYRLVRNREEAEDLTQETFIRVYRHIARYDAQRPFRNWLYTIATNVGLNALRSRQRRDNVVAAGVDLDDADGIRLEDAKADGRRMADQLSLKEQLGDAVRQLPPKHAMLVHLCYHEGMTIREAADVIGMTESGAKVALHRARKSLRELLIGETDI